MTTKLKQTAHPYAGRMLPLPLAGAVLTIFSFTVGHAQADPKKDSFSVSITSVKLEKKASDKTVGDSVTDVHVTYIKKDGTTGVLDVNNVKLEYTPNGKNTEEHGGGVIRYDDGSEEKWSSEQVKKWVVSIIQNPPDKIYYINGEEKSVAEIKKLDPAKVKTANIISGDEAVAKYGEKGREGVILLTTE